MINIKRKGTNNNTHKNIKLILPILVICFCIILLYCIIQYSHNKAYDTEILFLEILLVFSILYEIKIAISNIYGINKSFPFSNILLFVVSAITILMINFYKYEKAWKLSEQLTFIEINIGIVSAIVIIWGGYLALKQINEAAQANKLAAFSKMIDILQKETARKKREIIFNISKNKKTRSQWTKEEEKAAHDTLSDIDQIGLMVKYGLLDYKFLEGWTYSIYKCIDILNDYKNDEEAKEYCYKKRGDTQERSNYFLGVDELIRLRDKNIVFNYEKEYDKI